MSSPSSTKSTTFPAKNLTTHSPHPFKEVLQKLYTSIGHPSPEHEKKWKNVIINLTSYDASSKEQFIKGVEGMVGPHGFMVFQEIDHTRWLPLFLPSTPKLGLTRVILGNPLIAITMLEHDLRAGLFVPVEVLVRELSTKEGGGTEVSYLLPSSLVCGVGEEEKPELRKAAEVLDAKLEELVRWLCE